MRNVLRTKSDGASTYKHSAQRQKSSAAYHRQSSGSHPYDNQYAEGGGSILGCSEKDLVLRELAGKITTAAT